MKEWKLCWCVFRIRQHKLGLARQCNAADCLVEQVDFPYKDDLYSRFVSIYCWAETLY